MLWVIKGLGPGGAERLLCSLADAHDRREFRFEAVYALNWKTTLVAELEAKGVGVHPLGVRALTDLRWLLRLRRVISDGRFDVVHSHSPVMATAVRAVVRSLPRWRRPVLVSTEHNDWSSHKWLTRLANRTTFPADGAHIAVSQCVSRSTGPRQQAALEVVVHGVPVDEVKLHRTSREDARRELGFTSADFVVGTVANLRKPKNYPDLLRAAKIVTETAPSVRFVAVGQGPLESEVRALHARLGLGERFLLLGYRADAVRVMSAFDVFILASRAEGFPIALMEALMLGLPVVATEVGGIPEAIEHGVEGLIVPPSRPDRLAAAVLELVGDPDRRAAMAVRAERSGALFDIATSARSIEAVYRRELARPSSRPE